MDHDKTRTDFKERIRQIHEEEEREHKVELPEDHGDKGKAETKFTAEKATSEKVTSDKATAGKVHEEADRGREAASPKDIPKKGWRDILLRAKNETSNDNLSMIAAGVAFYSLLAIFPALAAMVSIYGLFADPGDVEKHIQQLSQIMPSEALRPLSEQFHELASSSETALSFGVITGILLALWSATKGVGAIMTALNIVYEEKERRSFIKRNLVTLGLTLGGIVFALVALVMVAAVPPILENLGMGEGMKTFISLLRWPILAAGMMAALAVLYRYAPSRRPAEWRWVSWGAVAATLLWLMASIAFSIYVSNWGNYDETYGSVGAVVILMMWFYLSAFVLLIGAELNAEMEHQTAYDTTAGKDRPMGKRDAKMADTLGEVPG